MCTEFYEMVPQVTHYVTQHTEFYYTYKLILKSYIHVYNKIQTVQCFYSKLWFLMMTDILVKLPSIATFNWSFQQY